MLEYISGTVVKLSPTYAVIDNAGIGYFIHISLSTCGLLQKDKPALLYIYEVIREDTHELFGFFDEKERSVFLLLISVSGVGANTARVMLSTLSAGEIEKAILLSDVNVLKSIKGIGLKTAQRIIVDLKDKVGKSTDENDLFADKYNTSKEEALSALVMLGFTKSNVEKVLDKLVVEFQQASVEVLVKESLKRL